MSEERMEAEKLRYEIIKYQTDKYTEAFNNLVNALKEYYTKGRKLITLSAFILIGIIFATMAFLTYYKIIGGETFAFVSGTIVGYIISLLAGK